MLRLLWVAVLVGACGDPDEGEPSDRDRADVATGAAAAIGDFFAATNQGDADGVLERYDPGEELVQIACTTVRRGFRAVEPVVRMWHQDVPDVALDHQVVRSVALGRDAAVVAAQGRNARGEALFWTFVVRRGDDGEWRVIQEHQSWAGCREPRLHPMS